MSYKVLVPIASGTEEIEAVCIIDTLRRAGAKVTVASVEKTLKVKCSHGIYLVADTLIDDCIPQTEDAVYDLIAIPGGMPGATRLRNSKTLTTLLKQQQAAGRLYGAICAAPVVVLQHHGLLEGKQATCFPSFASKLRNATASNQRVVVDGNCITSRGPGSAIEFALALIAQLYGEEKAAEVGQRMQVA